MNKILKAVLILVFSTIVLGIGYYSYNYFYGGTNYYVKVESDPTSEEYQDFVGATNYAYEIQGYDKKGEERNVEFTVNKDKPLKKDSYLKVTINSKKGAVKWEEVNYSDIPKLAKEKLE